MTPNTEYLLLHPGRTEYGPLYVEVRWDGSRLSLAGIENPRSNGDADSCGQNLDSLRQLEELTAGWTTEMVLKLVDVWERWHLNDMQAGSPAQSEWLRQHRAEFPGYPANHYEWVSEQLAAAGLNPDPADGYKYGSAWRTVEVPADVIEWLFALPVSTKSLPAAWRKEALR